MARMTGNEIRKAFLDYFAERGHAVVASGSLVPQGDATLMFANEIGRASCRERV